MSTITVESKPLTDLDREIRRGKTVLREVKATLEDLDDRREMAAAKKAQRKQARHLAAGCRQGIGAIVSYRRR